MDRESWMAQNEVRFGLHLYYRMADGRLWDRAGDPCTFISVRPFAGVAVITVDFYKHTSSGSVGWMASDAAADVRMAGLRPVVRFRAR